jgi:hypothetical protein
VVELVLPGGEVTLFAALGFVRLGGIFVEGTWIDRLQVLGLTHDEVAAEARAIAATMVGRLVNPTRGIPTPRSTTPRPWRRWRPSRVAITPAPGTALPGTSMKPALRPSRSDSEQD